MTGLAEFGPVVLEKKIFNVVNVFFLLFRCYLPSEKGVVLSAI